MKIIVTTSDKYLHLVPVFGYLFNKYMPGYKAEMFGYKEPDVVPDNILFTSMGEDRGPKYWSTDLRKVFEKQDDWFVWMMEDTFIKRPINEDSFNMAAAMCYNGVGRVDLTKDVQKREHLVQDGIVWASPNSRYRLSTQPSIWNKEFLLNYLHEGMTPWEFETQDPTNDGWTIAGVEDYPMLHNEGVRRFDIHALNLEGMDPDDIYQINMLC
jgi:hypothetical protein